MKNIALICIASIGFTASSCNDSNKAPAKSETNDSIIRKTNEKFDYVVESFGDIQVLRYQVNGFDQLNLKQQKMVYYLYQAGLAGRDIIWDQNYRHNLSIRTALEDIVKNYKGDQSTSDWAAFMTYTKKVWFANGIHHHYSMDKFEPEFSKAYFEELLAASNSALNMDALDVMFNDADLKRVSLNSNEDLMLGSAMNFYHQDLTEKDVETFYSNIIDKSNTTPVEYGLNSKLTKDENGKIYEAVYKVGGMYSEAISAMVSWLEKAKLVAENEAQAKALGLLVEYYQTGDLEKWSAYNIAWASATEGDIDYIQGFVEVYGDPLGMRGTYESIVQIKDFEASARMKVLAENAQWFEDKSSIEEAHKKENVVGVSYNVVNVAGESGDASPATPIGVNLPNADWIRANHGSKSVSLGNIVEAYNEAGGEGMLQEFAHDQDEIDRTIKYGKLASKLHTAMHEVIGHASGQINKGIGTPKETLKSYASTLEEARADLVALYYLMDKKLIDLGLMESLEVGMAEYDSYIRNGMMAQMRRLEPGADIEEAHMRNRQLVAAWAFEKGQENQVISKIEREGNTYFEINDYQQLKVIFGELLREIQRIKSEGDYAAGKALVENYGVKVDQALHQEVLDRSAKLNIPPYSGFVNPILEATKDAEGNITGITIQQPTDFKEQMLYYSSTYGYLSTLKK
ncbi:dihydrofolate reductase [Putridiphycobacter roseus]|uniref:Dihydrofolate reductase n=1 Tax=Putridiphycobacter roseus TaxID=2219161 RepID=A0A2W1NRM6_9FLAO|nr:dihydrofolate reductase [Putridiphycobacter roseus]PZE17318.1 dihydrofolate reductase [Putridiphycobacter roseus]